MKKHIPWLLFCTFVFTAALLSTVLLSRQITAMAEASDPVKTHTIVIDAGHGGVDGGAVSCTGAPESQYNLEIALRLKDLMELLGFKTLMVRTEDISVYTEGTTISSKKISDLKQRVRIVQEAENAILISIHQNNFPDSRYSGAVVLHAPTKGSSELAVLLQRNLISSLNPGSKRSVKKADGIYLLEHIQVPGVIIECGFLSNPKEEALLRNKNYQNRLCCVIASSVSSYLSENSL
ncbi:MAG: N-acetylmuramoyl-L-alanine amidase [Oscillospiraceae bacterium]|nr:N-acetylmuramoyl-L-alanine amidase [Oscillospiraceae bacterium]